MHTSSGEFTCDRLISTIPAFALSRVVETCNIELSRILKSIKYAPIALIHVAFAKNDTSDAEQTDLETSEEIRRQDSIGKNGAFGFLCSQYHPSSLKGAIYNSQIFPSRSTHGFENYTIFMDYRKDGNIEGDVTQVIEEFKKLKKIDYEAIVSEVTIWEKGIPQFDKPYLKRKNEIISKAQFEVSGSFISGVSVNDCIKYNIELAKEMVK